MVHVHSMDASMKCARCGTPYAQRFETGCTAVVSSSPSRSRVNRGRPGPRLRDNLKGLALLRVQAGLTQKELAARAGVEEKTLIGIEVQRSHGSLLTRTRVLDALGLPLELHEQVFGPLGRTGRKPNGWRSV